MKRSKPFPIRLTDETVDKIDSMVLSNKGSSRSKIMQELIKIGLERIDYNSELTEIKKLLKEQQMNVIWQQEILNELIKYMFKDDKKAYLAYFERIKSSVQKRKNQLKL